jgi:hypothetical protein
METVEVRIGSSEREGLTIHVLGRMHPAATDYWDGNWLLAPIDIAVGAYSGRVDAGLRVDELARFRTELEALYQTLDGDAHLSSIEGWVDMTASGDGLGHVTVAGSTRDRPGVGNQLFFRLEVDQTFLPPIIEALLAVERALPVLGRP